MIWNHYFQALASLIPRGGDIRALMFAIPTLQPISATRGRQERVNFGGRFQQGHSSDLRARVDRSSIEEEQPFAASVWITSSSSESVLSVVLSPRMFLITTAGALICRSAKTPRNSDGHRPAPKVRWSRFVKSVVYTTITNARPPK